MLVALAHSTSLQREGAKGADLADRLEKAAQVGWSVGCGVWSVNGVGRRRCLAGRLEKAAQVGWSVGCGGVNSAGLEVDSQLSLSSSVTPLSMPRL